jgi:hypothetical protein
MNTENFNLVITGVLNRVTNSDLPEYIGKDGKIAKLCAKFRTELEDAGFKWETAYFEAGNKKTTIQVPLGAHA